MNRVSVHARRFAQRFDFDADECVAYKRDRSSIVSVRDIVDALERRPGGVAHKPPALSLCAARGETLRTYQVEAMRTLYRKSGFLEAPCGAGKTLMCLLTAVANGGRCLVLTTRYADQWVSTFGQFFDAQNVRVWLYDREDTSPDMVHRLPDIVVATYSGFVAQGGASSSLASRIARQLHYTTLVLDEAHTAASPCNLSLLDVLHYSYVIATTATKVREDDELIKLERRIGPTCVAIDRKELVTKGYILDVVCHHLVVEHDERIDDIATSATALAIHPFKMQVLRSALQRLKSDGHRTLLFCDDLTCLAWVDVLLGMWDVEHVGSMSMHTPMDERQKMIDAFASIEGAVLLISRTGDEALNVPSASAAIVFWNHWKSRRQIVQRIGRIARVGGLPPVFLVLLADDARERAGSSHRETYLREHGFSVKVERQEETPYGVTLARGTRRYVDLLRRHLASTTSAHRTGKRRAVGA